MDVSVRVILAFIVNNVCAAKPRFGGVLFLGHKRYNNKVIVESLTLLNKFDII